MRVKQSFTFHFALLILHFFCLSCSSLHSQSPAEKMYLKGQYLLSQGAGPDALSCFQQSLELSRLEGFPAGIAHNLNEIAIYQTGNGNFSQARKFLAEALAIYRSEDMAVEVSKTLNNLANTFIRERKWANAMNRYEELLVWDKQTGNRLGEGITLYNMGLLNRKWLGRPRLAHRQLSEALVIFKQLDASKYMRTVEKLIKGEKAEGGELSN